MSLLHKEHGHFSRETQTKVRKMYNHICALCERPGYAVDHIFPLMFLDIQNVNPVDFGVNDVHGIDNAWLLCSHCHDKKSIAENTAYPNGGALSKIYNRYWKLAFTPKGSRRVKKIDREQVNRIGQRARRNYIVQGNRLKVALKKATATGNQAAIEKAKAELQMWRDRNPKRKRTRAA